MALQIPVSICRHTSKVFKSDEIEQEHAGTLRWDPPPHGFWAGQTVIRRLMAYLVDNQIVTAKATFTVRVPQGGYVAFRPTDIFHYDGTSWLLESSVDTFGRAESLSQRVLVTPSFCVTHP